MKRQASDLIDDSDFSENEIVSQSGGAFTDEAIFDFNFARVGPRCHWRNEVVGFVWIKKTKKNDALFPFETMMISVAQEQLSR